MTNYDCWPYGLYSLSDRVIVHDRKYRPLVAMQRTGRKAIAVRAHTRDGQPIVVTLDPSTATPLPADTWIEHDTARDAWFFCDKTSPRRCAETRRALQHLIESAPALAATVKSTQHVH
jgi:hypothetical protein